MSFTDFYSQDEFEQEEGRRLINAKINFVSYVDSAANKKTFLLTKSEGAQNVNKQVELFVKSNEERLVYGIVYEPNTLDAHGDYMTEEDIQMAAHNFVKEHRNIDKQHNYQTGYGELVESYIAPSDMTINGQVVKKGSWVLVTKASEAVWKDIKAGKITGYSMAGQAERVAKSEKGKQVNGLNFVSSFTGGKLMFKSGLSLEGEEY